MTKLKILKLNKADSKILEEIVNSDLRKKILGSFFKEKKIKNKKNIFSIIGDNQRLAFFKKNKENIYICRRLSAKLTYNEIIKIIKFYFKQKKLKFHLIKFMKGKIKVNKYTKVKFYENSNSWTI